MDLNFQSSAVQDLRFLSQSDRHSLLIEGPIGSGKSYLAKQYAKMRNIIDVSAVSPTVQGIREALEASYDFTEPVVFCIENLDTGVPAASFTSLKFLEEPVDNVYIVVTCRDRFKVPDTIISRSTCVTVSAPAPLDIQKYAQHVDAAKYEQLCHTAIWGAVRSLNDIEYVYRMTYDQITYYTHVISALDFKDTVSNIVWKLGHYSDNSEIDIAFMFNYIIATCDSSRIQRYAIAGMHDLATARIAAHAVLAKFVFECKYGE